jgi:energy-coupling factor transport system substrate-specific component
MKLTVKEMTLFGMLGAVMYCSKIFMEFLPNIHLLGVFTIAFTMVYRKKALYPIYVYVMLNGLLAGFNMLLPERTPKFVYILVCGAHGFLYGTLYAPAQAIMFGLDFKGMVAWIIAGLPYDCVHGIGNLCVGILIWPIVKLLRKLDRVVYE